MTIRRLAVTRATPTPIISADKTTASGFGVKPNSTVTVYNNGTQVGTATATGSGVWSYTFGSALNGGDIVTYDAVLNSPAYAVPTGPISVPAAPTITLTAGNGQVSVAWTDGANGGAAITRHKLYRGTASGSRTLVGTISTASPYVDTGLTNGTAYFYSLSAVNSAGEGPQSAEATASPVAPAATLASGAVGTWWYDQINTATMTVPNAAAGTSPDGNVLRFPRRNYANNQLWTLSNVAVSNDGATALALTGVNGDATTFTPSAASFYIRPAQSGNTLPAGNYTLEMVGSVASGSKAFYFNVSGNLNRTFSLGSLTTTPGRIFANFTAASAFTPDSLIVLGDGTDTAAFVATDLKLRVGTQTPSTTTADAPVGHLYVGIVATDTRTVGKYTGGELNMSTSGAAGLVSFGSAIANGTPFTVQAMMRKSAAGSAYQAFLSKVGAYTEFSAFTEQNAGPYLANNVIAGTTNGIVAGFWRRLAYAKHIVITHRYDGTNYSLWLDDIPVAQAAGSAITGFKDLWFNAVNGVSFTTGDIYAGGMTLYTSALTAQQIADNGTVIRARAQAAGVSTSTLGPVTDFIVTEADSRTITNTPWPVIMAPNLSRVVFGTNRAVSGATLDSGSNQVVSRIAAALPFPTRSGLRVYGILGMCGANDLGTYAGATDTAAAASYYGSVKANVFDAWTAKGVNRPVLITELPFPANGTNAHNTRKDLLNASYRNSFPGSSGGTLIDLENATTGDTRWADNNGANDYPTLYSGVTDGHPSVAGQQLIGNIVTTAMNALLAAA